MTSEDRWLPRSCRVTVAMCPSWLMATLALYHGPAWMGAPTAAANRGLAAACVITRLRQREGGGRGAHGQILRHPVLSLLP